MQEGYLGPPIMVGQAKNPVFNSLTPLFKYDNLTIKKTQVTFLQKLSKFIWATQSEFDAETYVQLQFT